MTFSIVARDDRTGAVGVATASFVLAVGARVPVVVPGAGAAVVQGGAPQSLRPTIRRRLEQGVSAQELIDGLEAAGLPPDAQVAVVDAQGRTASHSGADLEPYVEAVHGVGVCAVANLMEREHVPEASVTAFVDSMARGPLAPALLDALTRSDELGGDVRGRMSAALLVAERDELQDLRVDQDRAPIERLSSLHRAHRAHAVLARTLREHGSYADLVAVGEALRMAPEDPVCLGAQVLALLRAGRVDEAVAPARVLVRLEPAAIGRLRRSAGNGALEEAATEQLISLVRTSPEVAG
ncbi:DUF1028 domain-containing protein [Cellulomonas sp. NS3]|uniref:DUF1028 domain-containing protein n=1 Tax=Cellulomonas sp. NS3 TaxID=2973977 RepID=UPI00216358FB|nr:DUF1028 domain-containing protein [Cellulomonas sp. NS3]